MKPAIAAAMLLLAPGVAFAQQAAPEQPAQPPPRFETPPPPEAGQGPPRAADSIWGADAMRAARAELFRHAGGQRFFWFMGDRLEYRARAGEDGYLWDVQGFFGGDIHKFFIKSEGEGGVGEPIEQAELQLLYSRAVTRFFDVQAGLRGDFAEPERVNVVLGLQGLAPYLFELDSALFVSHRGEVTARIEAELDQRITQRLVLQPRLELNLAAQDSLERRVGAGLDRAELGLRLRYHVLQEFAPYIGVEQEWRLGGSARLAREAGEDPSLTQFVAGVRFWF